MHAELKVSLLDGYPTLIITPRWYICAPAWLVGYVMAKNMRAELLVDAITPRGVPLPGRRRSRRTTSSLVGNPPLRRGSQYSSKAFREVLIDLDL